LDEKSTPGTITVHKSSNYASKDKLWIINMFAQYYPGKAKYDNDSKEKRLEWFKSCLDQMGKIKEIESFAFPYGIGSAFSGGSYQDYMDALEDFAIKYSKTVAVWRNNAF
jgi:hypothetical protein